MRISLKTTNLNPKGCGVIVAMGLFLLACFVRFYKIPEFFTFNFDEEYQALMAWEQVKNFHPIWIGVSASNVNFYLGPGITYLNALLFWISKGDPTILGYFSAFVGLLTILSIYYVTKKLFSYKTAVISSIVYAFSGFLMLYDRRFWNDTPIPIISIWLLYSFYKVAKDQRWFILIACLATLSLHVHLSLLIFWPIAIWLILKNYKQIKPSIWFGMVAVFLIIVSPLIVFDLNHNFDNLLMPIRYFNKIFVGEQMGNLVQHWHIFYVTMGKFWFLRWFTNIQDEHGLGVHLSKTNPHFLLSFLSFFILIWFFYRSFSKKQYRLLSLSIVFFLVVSMFYPGGLCDYFFLGFFTLFCIAVGLFFSQFSWRLLVFLIFVFIIANSVTIFTLQQEQYGLITRKKLIQQIMPYVGNKSFYLETITTDKRKYHSAGGWRFLFKIFGRTPAQSHADDFFGWIYQDEISKDKPELRVIVSEYPANINKKVIKQFNVGVFYGYVLNNQ